MSSNSSSRQTTVLVGGSNGTATLCAILGDASNPLNEGHTVRVCTRNSSRFLSGNKPREWRCNEQKAWDLVPWEALPKSWVTHTGAPDSVLTYSQTDISGLKHALEGTMSTTDDGGCADLIMLCCPVNAHLSILKCIARALYQLQSEKSLLFTSSDKPLVIGTLYGGGGFDWMSRMAFASERPPGFQKWKRPLSLFALKSFPYLCKSTRIGEVTLYGRYPQIVGAICPSTPSVRSHAKLLLDRLLQSQTTGKTLEFIGLSSNLGGDGSSSNFAAVAAIHHSTQKEDKQSTKTSTTVIPTTATPTSEVLLNPWSLPMADHADPHSSLGFLTCTMNCTNQFLHPGICATLFHDPKNPSASDKDGTIPWPSNKPMPRFYGDGGLAPNAGKLMIQMGVMETYPIMATLDHLFAPHGMSPICSQHGGEPVGRMLFNLLGNKPQDLALRSGLLQLALQNQFSTYSGETVETNTDVLNLTRPLSFMLGYGLAKNSRVGSVLAPVIRLPDGERIKPNVNTRFFDDDIPHGLCILLGLAELLGYDLERDMKHTLWCVRRLQHWMDKEYVLKKGQKGRIIADAKDLQETSAPQAFGMNSIAEFQQFLKLSPFAENHIQTTEHQLFSSPIFTSRL